MMAILAFFGYSVQYIQRIDMSVAIVCMVNNTAVKAQQQSAALNYTERSLYGNSSVTENAQHLDSCMFKEAAKGKAFDGEFIWTKPVQGLILSAYFYGYVTTQVSKIVS
jgi:hypothetical protein